MKSNIPKIQLLFSALFFLISFSALFFFYRTINANNKGAAEKEGQWQSEAARRDGIRALDSSVKAVETQRTQLETHFAKSSDIVPFLDTIEGLAPQTGVVASVTSVAIAADDSGLLVGMSASGTFGGLYKFLTLLENSPYELEFDGVDLRSAPLLSGGGKNTSVPPWDLILKMKLLTFVQ